MFLKHVRIQNFRSIEDVSLDFSPEEPLVILEGPNDSGKSNVLEAIHLGVHHAAWCVAGHHVQQLPGAWTRNSWPDMGRGMDVIRRGCQRAQARFVVDVPAADMERAGLPPQATEWAFTLQWSANGPNTPPAYALADSTLPSGVPAVAALLGTWVRRVVATRHVRGEHADSNGKVPLWEGSNIKTLLYRFKNAEQPLVQERFELFREVCRRPELGIGDVFVSLREGSNEILAKTVLNGAEFPLEQRSTGVQQMLVLLATAICSEGSLVILEEPENNLEESRQKIVKRVLSDLARDPATGIRQLLVSSHSDVFEVDAQRRRVTRDALNRTVVAAPEAAPASSPDLVPLQVTEAGSVFLPEDVLRRLDWSSKRPHVFLRLDEDGVRLLSAMEAFPGEDA